MNTIKPCPKQLSQTDLPILSRIEQLLLSTCTKSQNNRSIFMSDLSTYHKKNTEV